MGLYKNSIPILEYDDTIKAILMPQHKGLDIRFPRKCIFAFLEGYIDDYALEHQAKILTEYETVTRSFPIYEVKYQGERICLVQAPSGACVAAQLMEFLIGYGVEVIISTGTCGTLVDIPENVFLVPTKALRDEGTSYHYCLPTRYMYMDEIALEAIKKTLEYQNIAYQEVMTWTSDGFYRSTKEMVSYRVEEGCSVVEMECSALMAVAKLRGVVWGEILFTADTLANAEDYDARNWGEVTYPKALALCLDIIKGLS